MASRLPAQEISNPMNQEMNSATRPETAMTMSTEDESLGQAEVLFVSLGSVCIPAGYISESGLRTCGYMPFDWICSKDGEKLIEIIKDDFAHFFDLRYYRPYRENPFMANNLLHTYYHFEFVHDHDIMEDLSARFLPKYERRVNRFRLLDTYQGRVVFVRYSSGFDPDCYWHFPENTEISDMYAHRLYATLRERFPQLKFSLVIMNRGYNEILEEETQLADNLWKVKFNPGVTRYSLDAAQAEVRIEFRLFLTKLAESLQEKPSFFQSLAQWLGW